eukprot:30884-Pelagococcus_subviridis.AAC.6
MNIFVPATHAPCWYRAGGDSETATETAVPPPCRCPGVAHRPGASAASPAGYSLRIDPSRDGGASHAR